MLAPAPYQMPVEEDKAESGRTKSSLHPEGISDIAPGGIEISSSEDRSEGEVKISFPQGKKRAASEDWEERASKRDKVPQSGSTGLEDGVLAQSHDGDKPLAES